MAKRDIFVIGGSAGSRLPLKTIVHALPTNSPGPVFIATHAAGAGARLDSGWRDGEPAD